MFLPTIWLFKFTLLTITFHFKGGYFNFPIENYIVVVGSGNSLPCMLLNNDISILDLNTG
jgi:hypothetical protein